MDRVGLQTLKKAYRETLVELGEMDRAGEVGRQGMYEPVSKLRKIHPEEEPNLNFLNETVNEIGLDLVIIDKEFAYAGTEYSGLMTSIQTRLDAVQQSIDLEEERLKDINTLCGYYSEFDSAKTLTKDNFQGNFTYDDNGTMFAQAQQAKDITYTIDAINGNGIEGNKYVYANDKFTQSTIDASDKSYINDGSLITVYEYSRITADSTEDLVPPEVNFDKEQALCTLAISADTSFNLFKINSDLNDIIVQDVSTSQDGTIYQPSLTKPIAVNSPEAKYQNGDYVYGSGIISFPETRYAKITFKSNNTSNDKIAFTHIGDDGKESIVQLSTAKRHVIRLNDLKARKCSYVNGSKLTSGELISSPVDSIAVFASEYIPEHFANDNYFTYVLTINGEDHEIVPINSQRSGIKVIKMTQYDTNETSTLRISEMIRSASLTIKIKVPNGSETPFLSNVKVCLGKGEIRNV